ncbi:MAG: hypothetical protein QM372_01980 [Bacillota bacterium]|nr:hypothetical protein [Bacillota bacterium]
MAILALYPHAKTLHAALAEREHYETAAFSLSPGSAESVKQEITSWLSSFLADLQFIVTNDAAAEPVKSLAQLLAVRVHTIDPASSDACCPLAEVTGTPAIKRSCSADAFIFRYMVRQEARAKGLDLGQEQFIAAHLDEVHQFGALQGEAVADALTSFDEGPFALRHSGGLPFDSVLDLCMAADTREEVLELLHEQGGLAGYLGLDNLEDLWSCTGEKADAVREALVYQISKEIGALAAVLKGQVRSILLGGELVRCEPFVEALRQRIGFIAPISVYPGNQGLPALLAGAQRILEIQGKGV